MKPSTKPPVVGLAEAARMCGVSVSTVRRKREELSEYGAAQTSKGWQIPIPALIATGLMQRTTPPPATPSAETVDTLHDTPAPSGDDALQMELEALRSQLVDAERRAAVAEAVAAERERIIEAQQTSLRMLETGASGTSTERSSRFNGEATSKLVESTPAIPEQATEPAFRAGWLSRFKRSKM